MRQKQLSVTKKLEYFWLSGQSLSKEVLSNFFCEENLDSLQS